MAENDTEISLLGALEAACCQPELSDVEFVVGDRKEVIPAHRTILGLRSPVWKAMLYGPMLEGKAGVQVSVPDIEPLEFRVLLHYAYTDKIFLNGATPIRCWYAANKYGHTKLALHCIDLAQSSVMSNNAASLLTEALEVGQYELGDCFLDFIQRHAQPVLNSTNIENSSLSALLAIVKCDVMEIKEIDVFKACIRWGRAECRRSGLNETDLRTVIEPLLPSIRFPIMSMEDIGGFVQDTGVLLKDEMLALLLHVANPKRQCDVFNSAVRTLPAPPRPRSFLVLGSEAAESRLSEVVSRIKTAKSSSEEGENEVFECINLHDTVPNRDHLERCGAVLLWSNNNLRDHDGISSLMSDYCYGGGGVVVATFALKLDTTSGGLGGVFSTTHLPVERGRNLQHQHHQLGKILLPDHPTMKGVTRFDGGTESHRNDIKPKAGAIVVAEWDDGVPFVVVSDSDKRDGGRCVVLNFFPVPKPKSTSSWDPTLSDGGKLLRNAMLFAAQLQ